jgi:hypothetical protein
MDARTLAAGCAPAVDAARLDAAVLRVAKIRSSRNRMEWRRYMRRWQAVFCGPPALRHPDFYAILAEYHRLRFRGAA